MQTAKGMHSKLTRGLGGVKREQVVGVRRISYCSYRHGQTKNSNAYYARIRVNAYS